MMILLVTTVTILVIAGDIIAAADNLRSNICDRIGSYIGDSIGGDIGGNVVVIFGQKDCQ